MSDLNHIVEFVWATLVRASLYALIVFPIAWLACYLLQKHSRRIHCWIWRIAYIKILVASTWIAPITVPLLPAVNASSANMVETINAPNNTPAGNLTNSAAVLQNEITSNNFRLAHLVTIAWFLGFVYLQISFFQKLRQAILIRRNAITHKSGFVFETYRQSASAMNCINPPRLLESKTIDVPALVGIFSPAVVIPAGFANRVSSSELSLVFRHELGHFKRGDLLWNLLPWLINLGLYFHPLNWLANRRWSACQEAACDELVLQSPETNSKSYAFTLIRVAEMMRQNPQLHYSTISVVTSYRALRERIIAMRTATNMSRPGLVVTSTMVAVIAILSILPWKPVPRQIHPAFINGNFESGDTGAWTITAGPNARFAYDDVVHVDIDDTGPKRESHAFALSVGQGTNEKDTYRHVDITQDLQLESGQSYALGFDWAVQNFYSIDNFDGGVFQLIVDGQVLASFDTENIFTKSTETGYLQTTFTASRSGLHKIGARIARRFPIPFPNADDPIQLQYLDNFYIKPLDDSSSN